jgi:hypothetical protein
VKIGSPGTSEKLGLRAGRQIGPSRSGLARDGHFEVAELAVRLKAVSASTLLKDIVNFPYSKLPRHRDKNPDSLLFPTSQVKAVVWRFISLVNRLHRSRGLARGAVTKPLSSSSCDAIESSRR